MVVTVWKQLASLGVVRTTLGVRSPPLHFSPLTEVNELRMLCIRPTVNFDVFTGYGQASKKAPGSGVKTLPTVGDYGAPSQNLENINFCGSLCITSIEVASPDLRTDVCKTRIWEILILFRF